MGYGCVPHPALRSPSHRAPRSRSPLPCRPDGRQPHALRPVLLIGAAVISANTTDLGGSTTVGTTPAPAVGSPRNKGRFPPASTSSGEPPFSITVFDARSGVVSAYTVTFHPPPLLLRGAAEPAGGVFAVTSGNPTSNRTGVSIPLAKATARTGAPLVDAAPQCAYPRTWSDIETGVERWSTVVPITRRQTAFRMR